MESTKATTAQNNDVTKTELLSLATDLVSAYVTSHQISQEDLLTLLKQAFFSLSRLADGSFSNSKFPGVQQAPAIPISESVTPEFIICLEDGKPLQMLKRHLKTVYGMSIEEYKEKWGLGLDYPTVAPNYAKRRSQIAKDTGLGSKNKRKSRISKEMQIGEDGQEQMAMIAKRPA